LFNEYSESLKDAKGLRVKGLDYENFERLCLERDIFTIRQQNSFINAATKTFLNVTDSTETFTKEFEKLSANLDSIYERLSAAINDIMDSDAVTDSDK